MEFFGFILLIIVLINVIEINSKVNALHRKTFDENPENKQTIHNQLTQNIGKRINIRIKDSYEEYGQPGITPIETLSSNEVKVLNLDKNWVHIEVYGKQPTEKFLRVESIAAIDMD